MARFEEMTHRGRVVRGPLADLVELDDGSGGRLVALCHHDAVRADPSLDAGLAPVMDFLSLPMVEGLARLEHARNGVFGYPVPADLRTARELIGVFAEEGGGGERAALELVAKAGAVLLAAAEAAVDRGLQSHGSLDPWRVGVDPSGRVTILGYGLPSLDGLAFQADERNVPRPDSLRYFPPERLDGEPEDVTSDLYALCLVAAELCGGAPVYDGADLLDQVSAGEAPERLGQLPPSLTALFAPMLAPYADKRPRQRGAWLRQVEEAARKATGRTLAELVTEGAAYLSDVEEDLPGDVSFAEVLGPEPEDPRVPALRDQIAEEVAALLLLAEVPAPEPVDDSIPEVAAAGLAVDAARERLAALADEVRGLDGAAIGTVPAAEEALAALAAARPALEEAAEAVRQATVGVREVVARLAAERAERQQRAVERARAAVAQAEEALEAFGEDEEAETQLGAARAALRKAEVARDPAVALRQLERAIGHAEQAGARLEAARAERSAAEAAQREAAREVVRARALAPVDALPADPDDAAEVAALRARAAALDAEGADGVIAEIERAVADLVAARAARAASRAERLATAKAALADGAAAAERALGDDAGDPRHADGLRELAAVRTAAAAAATEEALAPLRVRLEAAATRLAEGAAAQRREREEAAAAARAAAVRARLAQRITEAERRFADDTDDAEIARALGALAREREGLGAHGTESALAVVERDLEARIGALAARAEEVRAQREAARAAAVEEARARASGAAARATGAAVDREEPELQLYAADAAGAAAEAAGTDDPEHAAALAARAEAAAGAAEQLLAEIRAEEESVRRARLGVIAGLARKLEARGRRLVDAEPELGPPLDAAARTVERAAEVAAGERALEALEALIEDAERRAEDRRVAAEAVRAARIAADLAGAERRVEELTAAAAAHDEPMLVLVREEAIDALAALRAASDDDARAAALERIRAAGDSAEEVLVEVRAAAERNRLETERRRAEEERRRAEEERRRAEEERRAAEARAEEERRAAEARAEEERRAAEARAEEERRAAEARAEEERRAAEARVEAERRAEARRVARARLAGALGAARDAGPGDDEGAALLSALEARASALPDEAEAERIDEVVAAIDAAGPALAEARGRARAAREAAERAAAERLARVDELRGKATRVAEELVEATIRHEDGDLAALLADTEAALDSFGGVDEPEAAAALLERVEENARRAFGAIERLEAEEQAAERAEQARAVRLRLVAALADVDRLLAEVPGDAALAGARAALDGPLAADAPEVLQGLFPEIRALEDRARAALAARVEAERTEREEARRLAHEALQRAQASRWLADRADLLGTVLGARAEVEQRPSGEALALARTLGARVDELEQAARADAARSRLAALASAAAHVVGQLPDLPKDVPGPLAEAVAAVRHDAVALAEPIDDDDLDIVEGELALRGEALTALEAAARGATRDVAAWRSERIAAAVDRAQAASARAWAAWREASAVREDDAVRSSVEEADQAASQVAGATDPGDADWNAALAVAAADRAEEAASALQDEVRHAIAALSALQVLRDEAENELLSWGSPVSAGPEAELHQLWSRAEQAARHAERARVDELGRELRALADRIRTSAPPAPGATPAPVMSLAERIHQAQRAAPGGHAIQVGPTLSPDETNEEPTLRGMSVPPALSATPVPAPARPTLAPDATDPPREPRRSDPPSDGGSRKPSVADLQARLRARAAQRTTTPPEGLPAPGVHSDPPRPRAPTSGATDRPPTTGPVPAITSPTQKVRLPDVPTAPRPIPKSRTPAPAPSGSHPKPNPASEARTTLMTRDQLEKVLAAALADDDEDGNGDEPESDEALGGDADAFLDDDEPTRAPPPKPPPSKAAPPAPPKAAPPAPPKAAPPAPPKAPPPPPPPPPGLKMPVLRPQTEDDEDGGRTTVFRPSDFGADDDDPAEGY